MLHVNMPWRRTAIELLESEDESWLNQPVFKLSEGDSDSDDFDSGIGVAYIEAVAEMKKVNRVAAVNPNLVVTRFCNSSTSCLADHAFQTQGQLVIKTGLAQFTGVLNT